MQDFNAILEIAKLLSCKPGWYIEIYIVCLMNEVNTETLQISLDHTKSAENIINCII